MNKKVIAVTASCALLVAVAASFMGMIGPGGGGQGGGRPGGAGGQGEGSVRQTVVETQTPTIGTIIVTGNFVGTVEAGQQVTVYPKASGEVLSVNYKVGDTVEQGAALLQLNSSTLQSSIAQTQAALATSEAKAQLNLKIAQGNLENAEGNVADGYNSSLLSAEAAVKSAENKLEQDNIAYRTARRNYNDAKDEDGQDVTDTALEALRDARIKAELAVESSQLSLEQAKANLEAVKKQVAEQNTSVADSLAMAELNADFTDQYIALEQQKKNLADYTVMAPISGVIEQRNLDVYDMASQSTPAFIITNKESVTITFGVAESSLTSMRVGDEVTVEKNGETCGGYITEISNMVDSASGLFNVKAAVENAPFELRSGSTITIKVATQRVENEIMIPINAVYYDNGKPFVYLFVDGKASKTFIETGISDAQNIQVVSGVKMTDNVIVTWSASLYDTAEVYLPGTAPTAGEGGAGAPGEQAADATDGQREELEAADQETADSNRGGEAAQAGARPGVREAGGEAGESGAKSAEAEGDTQ